MKSYFGMTALLPLVFLSACALVREEAAVTHQVETFTFENEEGRTVDDLRVDFNVHGVKTQRKGRFKRAQTNGSRVTLSGHPGITNGNSEDITFEKDGKFTIVGWQWTANGRLVGNYKPGSP